MKRKRIWLLVLFLSLAMVVEAFSLWEKTRVSSFKKEESSLKDSSSKSLFSKTPQERTPLKPITLTLELELIGTALTNTKDPLAFIRDLKTDKQGIYKLGHFIRGAKLIEISRGKVVFEIRGRKEVLGLSKWTNPENPIIRPVGENKIQVSKTGVLNEGVNIYDALRSVKIKPHYEADKVIGLMVDGIAKGSILEAAGIRNKDIINTVNNQRLESYQEALEVSRKLRNQSEIKISLFRDGAIRTLTYHIGQ
jgi:type II secretion system protein C